MDKMPSRPCPHCPLRFASQVVLETHIAYVHPVKPVTQQAMLEEADALFLSEEQVVESCGDASETIVPISSEFEEPDHGVEVQGVEGRYPCAPAVSAEHVVRQVSPELLDKR